jgi:hypothetical protein
MIELVLTVCSILHGAKCNEVKLSFAEQQVSAFECMMYGQLEIAKWRETHPDWQVAKWQCGRAGLMAKA